jgi:DinB family protein
MPHEPRAKLNKVRKQTHALLPNLVGDARVYEKVGEGWTARKVVRRTLWHEGDHTEQIARILNLRQK